MTMRSLIVFNSVTVDGYFTGPTGDMSWAHREHTDPEFDAFVAGNAKTGGMLLMGRVTYDMMASWWPTPQAIKAFPEVAAGMNSTPKVVFSRKMEKADWNNTRVVKGDLAAEVKKLKQEPGPGMAILGSGSIVAQLAPTGLIDEYTFVLTPVVLGNGRTLFDGMKEKLNLELTKSRPFKNGNVVLSYSAA
jgi:dihydrofolate reductase